MNLSMILDWLERSRNYLSNEYLNTQIGHHMDPWWQKCSKDVYGDDGSRGDQNVIELKTLKE